MKCIRFIENGKPVVRRTTDETAKWLVENARAEYAPKADWKVAGREYLKDK